MSGPLPVPHRDDTPPASGVRPDLVVQVRLDILREVDGPMLRYGLQEMQGSRLATPRATHLRPRPEFLEERFALFQRAA